MMLPDELEWVLQMLGYNWPTADEDKLRDSAALWRKFGDDVTGLHTSANTSARTVTAHNAGESIDAFSKTYAKFDGGGGSDGYLANAAQAAHIIANVMEACAYLVEFAKWAVIAQLIALAIQIAAAAAAAPFTFGLSSVAGMGATQAARLIVRRLLDELKQALMEAIVEAMKEPAVSAIEAIITDLVRQTMNVGFGAQQGYDLSETAKAGAKGGWEAIKQTPQTLAEGVRDGLGKKAGDRAHHAIDSRIDGYDGSSGPSGSDGGDGGSGSRDGGDSESGSRDGGDSDSRSSNSSSDSGSSSSDSSTSTRTSTGTGPGANIGGGISADSGGAGIGTPDVGVGPNSDSGSGSGSGPGSGQDSSSSDTPYSRPTPSLSGPSLSDFDDPSPGTPDANGSSGSPSTSGPSGTNGGSSVSGLSSPTAQSAPTPTSSGATSSSPGSGAIGTSIDSLAASVPTQSNAAPTPTTSDPSPAATGGRADGGSAIPTSPVAPSTAGGAAGSHHTGSTPGSTPSATSPTGPTSNSGAARNPSAGTPSPTGTGPASTPSPTSATTPRSTPAPTPDGRAHGTADGRTPGTPVGRTPGTPDGRTPGAPDGRTPGAPDGRTPTQRTPGTTPGTTPSDGTSSRNNPGTRPGDSTPTRNTPDPTGGTRTHTPGQNPSTSSPSQNPAQSTPSRTASPSTSTPTTTPSPSSGAGPERTSTPSSNTPNSSTQPGAATSTSTPGTPGTQNQPGTGPTPSRPPHQPAGSTPNTPHTPNTPQQPGAQPNTPAQNTPPNPQHQQQQQVTAVPIHTVITTPGASTPPSHATPDTPQAPGSPQTNSGTPENQQHPEQDSLEDIRADLDHYPGGLSEPDPDDQQALADAVPHNEDGTPERFPDPFGPWSQLQNDGGNEVPGRSNNCADCSRSFLETWYGNPQVSAPRTLDSDEHGNPDPWSPEDNANENQIRWTGAAHTYAGPGNDPDTANNIASVLQQSGPGSAAIVQVDWPNNGGGHAFNVVNHNGNIVWIDTQSGEVSTQPLHIDNAEHVWHIPLDADRNPIDLTQPDAADSEGQNDQSQPEASENNGQPPQNGVSPDTPEQGDNTDTGTISPESAAPSPPDAANNADPAQPSTADPSMSPDPDTPDGQGPSQDTPETRDSDADQQQPDGATHPDEQGRTPDKESEQPTATAESPTRPDSPSEHGQPPSHTTPVDTDNGTPDKDATPTRTATDPPNDPTTNRDTAQQTTTPSDPRTSIPHQQSTDPRATDPRTADPRTTDPRTSDPRTSDPHRDTGTQRKPETSDRPDGQRPDRTRPDHVDDNPRLETPDKDRSETQSPADDRRNRPSDMTKDSAVPIRESLPDGKNADASRHINESTAGKKHLYGEVAPETSANTGKPETSQRPEGPAQPTGDPINDPRTDDEWIDHMVHLANTDPDFFDEYYRESDGHRHSREAKYKGHYLPILRATGDPQSPWMPASRVPQAPAPTYVDPNAEPVGRTHGSPSQDTLDKLDERAGSRADAIEADRVPHAKRETAKQALKNDDTPENRAAFKEADDEHRPFHAKRGKESETYGDEVAEFHAIPNAFAGAVRIDNRGEGNNRFDQVWDAPPNETEFDYVVVECKGSLTAGEGDRQGLPLDTDDPDRPEPGEDGYDEQQTTGDENQEAESDADSANPAVPQVAQGTREYFKTIMHEMRKRGLQGLNEAAAETDPVKAEAIRKAAQDELDLARNLRTALKAGRVKYVLVKGNSNETTRSHEGYLMKEYDIRPRKDEDDQDSTS
ncbi:toxin glutamine deamidase domain-containing protein [Streptomyces sp. GESEQ-35]|uniref:toxin glutamine deamidase domain-containing protein n=1 Tax=Streptomyces sp. GESEQ-35 TaxID=2812657 RepID=UPI001B328C21|nr:toxin glutamine deamidase domain-containing protein [Streptomyces sp. GESEQ-35]